VLHHDDIVLLWVDRPGPYPAVARVGIEIEVIAVIDAGREVNRRAAGDEHPIRALPHLDHTFCCILTGNQVNIGELGVGMADFLVDGASHFTALHMGERNIHISGGDGCGNRFKPVGNGDDDIRPVIVENGRKFLQGQPGRFGRSGQVFPFEQIVNAGIDRKAVALDVFLRLPVKIEQH